MQFLARVSSHSKSRVFLILDNIIPGTSKRTYKKNTDNYFFIFFSLSVSLSRSFDEKYVDMFLSN